MRGLHPVLALVAFMAMTFEASAAPPAVCTDFANYAMAAQSQYYARNCPRVPQMNNGGPNGMMGHYNWCISRPLPVVQADRQKKEQLLNACLSGGARPNPATARTDQPYCEAYGREMTGLWAQAKAKGCKAYMSRQNHFDMHFGWCMRQTRAVAQRGLEGNRKSVLTCR